MRPIAPALAAAVIGLLAVTDTPARGLDFAQLDGSSDSTTLVLVRALGEPRAAEAPPLLAATATRWADGEAGSIAVTPRWTLAGGDTHQFIVGAGVGAEGWRSRAETDRRSESALSLRGQAEALGSVGGAGYYVLAQASTFRGTWFATAQVDPRAWPVAVELSRFGQREYHATSLALRVATGAPGWSLRLGAVSDGGGRRPFFGVVYNGF